MSLKKIIKKLIPSFILQRRNEYLLDRQRKLFHQDCQELLEKIDNILRSENIPYWLNYGTLLGAYRDGKFIPHDYDMDVALFYDDMPKVKNLMLKNGMTLTYEVHFGGWEVPENVEYRFKYKNAFVDFDFYKLEDGIAYTFNPDFCKGVEYKAGGRFPVIAERVSQDFCGLSELMFLGRKYMVPSNTEEYIIANYGPNFRTPVKNFNYHEYAQNLHIYTVEEKPSFMEIY